MEKCASLRPFAQRIKTFASPARYIQGPDAIRTLGRIVSSLGGKRAILIGGKSALEAIWTSAKKSCQSAGIRIQAEKFGQEKYGPECCWPEIRRLENLSRNHSCDTVISAGGGKAIDTGKAVADLTGALSVVLPTIAATDAPTSSLSAIYDENTHEFKEAYFLRRNPDIVLVDTQIVAKAPARMQCAGMGDGFAKKYEGEAVVKANKMNTLGGVACGGSTYLALQICRLTDEIYREYGYAAMLANLNGLPTPPLEWVIEANILMSGLGFESCGVAVAHGIYGGLTALEKEVDPFPQYHGELVHFGTLSQMVLEDRSMKEIHDVMEWSHSVGLPTCFKDIGLANITDENLELVARKATETGLTKNMCFDVTPELLVHAMKLADSLGKETKTPRLVIQGPNPYPWRKARVRAKK